MRPLQSCVFTSCAVCLLPGHRLWHDTKEALKPILAGSTWEGGGELSQQMWDASQHHKLLHMPGTPAHCPPKPAARPLFLTPRRK